MAWERRQRGGQYYYRSSRIGGRVVKEYIGTGPEAELIADMDERNRAERQETIEAVRRAQHQLNEAAEPLVEFGRNLEILVQAALLAGGYHYRKGEWRRRRYADITQAT